MKFPFISEIVNNKIRNAFKKQGYNIRLYHPTNTLKKILTNKTNTANDIGCNLNNCLINEKQKCLSKNVIYQIKCNKCKQIYIGSTQRNLHVRIKEHTQNELSSVRKHLSHCNNERSNIEIKIIHKENDTINLRFAEALFIKKYKPTINNKEECNSYMEFLM